MKVFKRVSIYDKPNKTNLAFCKGKSGVYIIYENGKKVYVGQSSYDLYMTITRHFQKWDNKHVSYHSKINRRKYSVTVIFCTAKQAASLEFQLIRKFLPRDNTMKYPELWPQAYDKQVIETFKKEERHLEDPPF